MFAVSIQGGRRCSTSLPVTEQPQDRDFCNRNLKRTEGVARNLVGAWEREEQTGQLLLGIGQRCFPEVSAGGNSPAAIYWHFWLKKTGLGEIQHRGRWHWEIPASPSPISSLDEETNWSPLLLLQAAASHTYTGFMHVFLFTCPRGGQGTGNDYIYRDRKPRFVSWEERWGQTRCKSAELCLFMLQGIFGRRGIPVSKWPLSYK